MSFCWAAGIALCFSEVRRKQCAMCADGGKKYERKNNEGLVCSWEKPCGSQLHPSFLIAVSNHL
jgi:hypothetical protein